MISTLRRSSIRRELSERRAASALAAFAGLRAIRCPVIELANVVWDLRADLTAYDAACLTIDRALASAARAEGRLA